MTPGHRPAPATALPPLSRPQEAYCAYSIILMALFWCTEALPLAVTALFPIILYPMMGIMDASEVSLPPFPRGKAPGMEGVCSKTLVKEEDSSQAVHTEEGSSPLLGRSGSTKGGVS